MIHKILPGLRNTNHVQQLTLFTFTQSWIKAFIFWFGVTKYYLASFRRQQLGLFRCVQYVFFN